MCQKHTPAFKKAMPISNSVECGRDGIVRIIKAGQQTPQSSQEFTLHALQQLEVRRQNKDGSYVLLDIRGLAKRNYHYEAQILRADCDALAVLGASTLTRVVSNILIRRYKPERPVRYFASSKKATHWLEKTWRQKQI